MLGIPESCIINLQIDLKRLPLHDLDVKERKKFKESIIEMVAVGAVGAEEMPPYVTETHNVQKIQFISVRLKNLNAAPGIAAILQRAFKAFTLISFHDDFGEIYSFSLKRLNLNDSNSIVVTDEYLTPRLPVGVGGGWDNKLEGYAGFETAINRTNLFSWYVELLVKCYIIANQQHWSGLIKLLDSKVWYDTSKVLEMYEKLKRLVTISTERQSAITTSEAVKLNGELKEIYLILERYF